MNEEVAFVAQDLGHLPVLFGQQVEPQGHPVNHGQNNGPQETQNRQDPLDHLTVGYPQTQDRGRR